ncbi:metal-sensitive transcriptional regulator [Desulfofundulus sp.]|uniref:metal-sensitive transcriptional regulator n=1 Tax=Desulfofundulus sp. TaxID=2282750 RepID=UPI003C795503
MGSNYMENGAGKPDRDNTMSGHHLLQGELLQRLKKIEGQVRGVSKMIEECRSCGDIVTQLAAIKAAVNRVGLTVLACYMVEKIEKDLLEGKDIKKSLDESLAIFKKFS